MGLLFGSLRGTTAYFERPNLWFLGACATTTLLAIVFAGGVLRALRPAFHFGRVYSAERFAGVGALLSLLAGLVVLASSSPSVADVQRALAAGDVAWAQKIVDALISTKGERPDVREADDAVTLAEAQARTGEAKLALLDKVANRGGTRSKAASDAARAVRFTELRELLATNRWGAAVERIGRWWPGPTSSDTEVSELRAEAEEEAYAACLDEPCRYAAAVAANTAASNQDRATRASASRQLLVASLTFSPVAGEQQLARLKRLKALAGLAEQSLAVATDDQELADTVRSAKALASSERAKVALVGADEPVVAELLGALSLRAVGVEMTTFDGLLVFLSFDGAKKCRGVYLVGPKEALRSLDIAPSATAVLLSQSVGHPATIRMPSRGASTSRWLEGGTPVVGRWSNEKLVELRIGEATP
jgi:hypothetical protein